jgi:ADP-ribose pyrophosphatase
MEIVATEELFKGKLKGVRETVRDDNGREFRFELIHHPGAVVVLPILEDGTLALIHQYRHALRTSIFELPAGTLEVGEEPLVCARREIREEIGYDAREIIPLGILHPAPGFCDEVQHLFVAKGLFESPATKDLDEVIEVQPMSYAEVEKAIQVGTITDAKTIATLFRARLFNYL